MNTFARLCLAVGASIVCAGAAEKVKDLNTPRTFPEMNSKAEWQKRADQIREHVLVSCGLWPMPEKTPLNAHVFGRIERDGYSVEKVYLETYPGFFLGGNLYRPLGKGAGPFPGVLNPHGHWEEGRLADQESGSIAARCISFARQGMVAFSYDMAGYNDTKQVQHRAFATNPTNLLWSISLMGLQTWDSIRALDFLESLPDVDAKRLACTGESGGGTQTFMLGSIDSRLALQAPIVMVSHSMQGGCLCENAPGLRVDYSNMEIAAVPAPRPQILVAATGDWTRATMTIEGPALEHIYDLFGARDHLRYVIFPYNHNYNKTSREAVYEWFGRWLLKDDNASHFKELPYKKEPNADLLAFTKDELPPGALTQDQLLASFVERERKGIEVSRPHDAKSLRAFKRNWRAVWEHSLQLTPVKWQAAKNAETKSIVRLPDHHEVQVSFPETGRALEQGDVVALIASTGESIGAADELRNQLRNNGGKRQILVAQAKLSEAGRDTDQFKNFFSTYNRTVLQDRVADLKAAAQFARTNYPKAKIVLIGIGSAGPATIAAAPLFDGVAADCDQLDDSKDENLLDPKIFFPGLRRIGSLQGMAALAAPNPLYLHNTGGKLQTAWLKDVYQKESVLRESGEKASISDIAKWISQFGDRKK